MQWLNGSLLLYLIILIEFSILIILFTLRPLRGASAVVIGAGPAHALYFSSYEFSKEALNKAQINGNLSYGKKYFN